MKHSPPITPQLAAHIKFLLKRGGLFQQQIAALLAINQGRVSEVKNGQIHLGVPPVRGPFPI